MARKTKTPTDNSVRQEVEIIRQTIAEVECERYTLAAYKRILVEQLRLRFQALLAEMEQVIESTEEADRIADSQPPIISTPSAFFRDVE